MMSSGGDAVLLGEQLVASAAAISSLRSRVTAMPCLVLVDAADDQRRAELAGERHDLSKRSSPSSRLIELMIALPWQ